MNLSDQIKLKYELGDVLHMTDLANLESILSRKAILSHNKVLSQQIKIKDISNNSVQIGRASIVVSSSGKPLHNYVPLYWGKKTPMVAALQNMNQSLIFMMFSTDLLGEYECVIADGNARSNETVFVNFTQLNDLDVLNPKDINTLKYAANPEIKRRKQAEILVHNELPLKYLRYIICHSVDVKLTIEGLLTTHGVKCGVYIGRGNYYF
jgi:hypothetical protein